MKTLAEYERDLSQTPVTRKTSVPLMELSAPDSSARKGGGILLKKEYLLMHPERPRNGTMVWEQGFVIDGQTYPVICDNGTVRTREEALKDFFIKQGWILEKTTTEETV